MTTQILSDRRTSVPTPRHPATALRPCSSLAGLDVRVVVADHDVLVRSGLERLLDRPGFSIAGQAGDPAALVDMVRSTSPDLVIVDISMPPSLSVDIGAAIHLIREEAPDVAVLILSSSVDVENAAALFSRGGGMGYLLKGRVDNLEDVVDAAGQVARGGSVVDPIVMRELVSLRRRTSPLDVLSAREREVLCRMAEGRSNLGIARSLFVSEGTVEKHVRSILTKLDIDGNAFHHRRVRAVITFLEAG